MTTIIPIDIFPIEDDGWHLKVEIEVNGKKAAMILDTGASRTVFDETRVLKYVDEACMEEQDKMSSGLGTNSMASKKVPIEKLAIGDLELLKYSAVVLDLIHVNQSYEGIGLDPVDGVLGGDILKDFNAVIDYGKMRLTLKY